MFLASRPKFLTASASPVLVGSALGFAIAGTFNWPLFLLALFAIMALHSGANIANDYFDHLSGNDWANKNVTPFSGGRQFIQQNILSPKTTLAASLFCLALGVSLGLVILYLTRSWFILILGLTGLLGGFFYTAPPVKLGYRGVGEIVIAFLFGILPVYGSYYLQTGLIDIIPLPAACIVGILIFLIIFINEFPDLPADAAVNKKTFVVRLGIPVGVWIYRIAVISTFVIMVTGIFVGRVMALAFASVFPLWPARLCSRYKFRRIFTTSPPPARLSTALRNYHSPPPHRLSRPRHRLYHQQIHTSPNELTTIPSRLKLARNGTTTNNKR